MSKDMISFEWAIKKILREEKNFPVLEGFLSELLKFDIKIVEIFEKDIFKDKSNKLELIAKNRSGKLILIELQYSDEINYFQKMFYKTVKSIEQSIRKKYDYKDIKKIYSINITNFEVGDGEDYVYYGKLEFRGLHTYDKLKLSDIQKKNFKIESISDICPEYYVIRINQFNNVIKKPLDEWIYFFKNGEIKEDFRAKGLIQAREILDPINLELEDRLVYEREQESRKQKESLLYTVEKKGIEKGLKKGLEEGKKEGKKEAQIEIAKNLLDVLDVETIAKKIELTVKELKELRDKIKSSS